MTPKNKASATPTKRKYVRKAVKSTKPNVNSNGFTEDYRQTKPSLHLLYTKWACQHLQEIDKCIKRLSRFSNWNLAGPIAALTAERAKLVKENAAYADAQEIFNLLAGKDESEAHDES